MAAVTGSVSRCSLPPAAPAPAQVLLSAHSCPTQAPQSPNVTSVTPQAPLVTHRPFCPSLHVPHRSHGCPFQGISSLEHGGDNSSVPSPSQVTWGWHRGWRTLTIKFAQVGILKQHPPFPLIKIVSHLILKGITARLPIWEIQNRALFMPAQLPTLAPDCPFLLLS